MDEDGNPWFRAKDVCRSLELENVTEAIRALDADEKGSFRITEGTSKGGNPNMLFVSEPGLYSLVFRSRKPEAKAFKRWVTHEILPAIRKHGAYLSSAKVEEVFSAISDLAKSLSQVAGNLAAMSTGLSTVIADLSAMVADKKEAKREKRTEAGHRRMVTYRNQAIVEYLANREEIDRLLAIGHSRRFVYDKLFHSGKISMSLAWFYELVRNGVKVDNPGGAQGGHGSKWTHGKHAKAAPLILTDVPGQEKKQ
jgi:prophage antirepressor-like protein